MVDDRVAALPAITTSAKGAEWHVIRAGNEIGPLSLAELIGEAMAGRTVGDDLVKQTGGLWAAARTIGFLQHEFDRRAARNHALKQRDSFDGIWLSRKALAIGAAVVLFLVTFATAWAVTRRSPPVPPDPPKEQPAQVFIDNNLTAEEQFLIRLGTRVKTASVANPLANVGKGFFVIPAVSANLRDEFPEDRIKARVELRLRQNGFSITPESPNRLVVQVTGVWQYRDRKTTMGTEVSINLRDTILAMRPNGSYALMDASIWCDAYTGVSGNLALSEHIYGGIDLAMDKLLNEYHAANPR